MRVDKGELTEFVIGRYICPRTKLPATLKASRPLAFVEWPVVVEKCASCGHQHVLQSGEVYHRPVFGYE